MVVSWVAEGGDSRSPTTQADKHDRVEVADEAAREVVGCAPGRTEASRAFSAGIGHGLQRLCVSHARTDR